MKNIKEFIADISLVTVALSWGFTFILVQDAIKDIPVFSFLFLRFLLSFLFMALFSLKFIKELSIPLIKSAIFLGTLFFAGYAFQTYGLFYTKSSIVAFITGLNVIIVPIIMYLFLKVKVYLTSIIGAVLAIFGLWMLTGGNSLKSINIGEIYSLICAIFFATHIVYTAKIAKKYNVFLLVTIELLTIAIYSLILSLINDINTIPKNYSQSLITALIITVIFATVYALLVQTYMQRFTTPAKTAIIFTIEPVSAAIFSYFYADETLNYIQITGGIIMIIAILLTETGTYLKNK